MLSHLQKELPPVSIQAVTIQEDPFASSVRESEDSEFQLADCLDTGDVEGPNHLAAQIHKNTSFSTQRIKENTVQSVGALDFSFTERAATILQPEPAPKKPK